MKWNLFPSFGLPKHEFLSQLAQVEQFLLMMKSHVEAVYRIMALVEHNREFCGFSIGDNHLECAAETLSRLIEEHKGRGKINK